MKKTLRKIIPALLIVGTATMSGCSMYTSKADTLENIVGFYELEKWEAKREKADEEPYDRKGEEGTVAYFTIDANGYSYYGFKDNNTEAWVRPAFTTYTHDDDEPELYKAATLKGKVGTVYAGDKKVGCLDEPIMGFKRQEIKSGDGIFKKKEMVSTLAYTIPWSEWTIGKQHTVQKYQYVQYKRISGDTGFQVINQKLGTNYTQVLPYEMEGMKGRLVYRVQYKDGQTGSVKGIYEYAVIDLDTYANGKVNLYYSRADNPGQHEVELTLTVKEAGKSMQTTIFEKPYWTNGVGFETDYETPYSEEELYNWSSFSHSEYSYETSLEDIIAAEKLVA